MVNGGTLDTNGQAIVAPSLAGTGGTVDVDGGSLTLNSASGSTSYAGSITGAGGLTKLGASTQTLTGTNTYTGATTIGGGTLALDFTGAGAPASGIISASSPLVLSGGTLSLKGGSAAASQGFGGLTVTAGNNRIITTSGAGGMTLNLGGIARTGGLVDFGYDAGSTIRTTHADGALGGWATVNGTDYAQVSGGVVTAFTNYQNKDDASLWVNGDIVSDAGGTANTPYKNTVNGSVNLGGLKYTATANSTVNVGTGNLLGIDGTIIVTSTVGGSSQAIQGGSVSGGPGGGALGVQQNSAGTFIIGSTVIDNGVPTSFTVGGSGTGEVRLSGANTYTGATTISGSTLEVTSVANGGTASSIGASSADASNLVIENGTFLYSGGVGTTDRGFTLVNGGPSRNIQVYGAGGDLTFSGQVTSPDDAGFTKTGDGVLRLTNATNDFTGPVTVSDGELSVATIGNGGQASSLGAGSSDSASLVLQSGGSLQYTGGSTTTDRGFTLAGGAGHVDVAQGATELTVDGTVIGAGNLIKDGDGTLILGGTNTYTGGTTVTAGTLRAASDQAFGGQANGAGAGQLTVGAGATADLDGHKVWITGLNGAGNVTLGAATGSLQLRGTGTFSGSVSGAGGVAVSAGGNQTFTGCGNSYTGPTSIVSGSLTTDCLANAGQSSGIGAATSDPANLTMSGGWLVYTGASVATDRGMQLAAAGGIAVNDPNAILTWDGLIQGPGQLLKGGDGTLLVTEDNTFTGGLRIESGVVRAGGDKAFGQYSNGGGGLISIDDYAGATLDLAGHAITTTGLNGGGTTGGVVDLAGGSFTMYGGGNSVPTYAGIITGTGSVIKNGGNTQALSGCGSDYVGTTTLKAGALAVTCLDDGGSVSSIGASTSDAANIVLDGGILRYVGAGDSTDRLFTLGASSASALDASGTGAVHFTNTGAIAFSSANTTQTVTLTGTSKDDNSLAAQITENGTGHTSLRKMGDGTWILRNTGSTYTGATTINGGVLGVDHLTNGGLASSIGASSSAAANLVIGNGATLRYTGAGDTTDRLFTLSLGSSVIESSGTGAIVFANTGSAAYSGSGNRTLGLGGENTGLNTMGGTIIDGPGGVTTLAKNGGGTWLLTGNNTFTGNTVINGGLLQIGNGGTTGTIGSPSITVAAGTLGFDRSDTMTLGGTISGAGNVQQSGSGTTALTATNTYTGGTSITAGTLQLGNGGASGSIVGNVADDGTLAFMRSDAYTFGGLVSGTGNVSQTGNGTTVLTAANSYKGATTVQAGSLLIDGDQSAATGQTTAMAGATLGGKGTIGGNVTVTGGTLDPGDASGNAGTLTINGNLSLDAASTLKYQFGQPNVVGGTLNDLTVVHGNLSLDGKIDFSATPGGSFGPGLYRIVSYDGTLADNGLDIGSTPGGTSYQVQTSVAHQVNLLNSGGLTLNFWDGPTGHGNSTVDGGTGVWQASGGNDNWTDQTGQYNAPYKDSQFGIFMGTPGTVTVDNTLGPVTSSGMQFAVDGYNVTGDPITLAGGQNVFRVGDGTAAGATMTATIGAVLSGTGGLVKQDLGTLVVTGNNTYTGGTTINGGVLQALNNNALGAVTGGLSFDDGTLRTTTNFVTGRDITINQGGATLENVRNMLASGVISGPGALTKTGAGTLILSGINTYTGGTAINAGTISVSKDVSLGNAAGALSFNGGTLQNQNAFTSARGVTLGIGGGTFDTLADLTLTGGIAGNGALKKIDGGALVLAADNTYTGGTTISAGVLQLGNGGTTGSILGEVSNDGTLVFDRSNTLAMGGFILGSGALEQQGSGTTVLSADNTYSGTTAVRTGSLIVNGDQSIATGTTSVDSGGTLGGKGTIGGDVNIADGGTLSPGDVGNAPGTLTIKGNLALSDTSNLNVNMGQANVVGGPLNDLVQVAGDLALDGTLNVDVSSGGSFGAGIYRIVGYDGALNDAGLNIGSVPSTDYFLQTSVAHQVNLVNTAGLDVNIWDGNGARGDGQIQGGDGVWQGNAGNDNWTFVDGTINAAYHDSSFSIFTGIGGTVSVDGSQGAINSTGMQFAVDGYRVEGDDINLVDSPVIRVGDGTTAGAGMTATIASTLTGVDGLTKSDLGTLVLTGDNTYTGGTTISDGTLQIGEGGTTGSILGAVVNDGTLAFNRSDIPVFAGAISGTGGVEQVGSGGTMLLGNNTYTGATNVRSGSLFVDGDQSGATGLTSVFNGGTLGGDGTVGGDVNVADGGTLSPGHAQDVAGTLTINGNLGLSAGSRLDYQFGQAGTVGGALNDQTVVHGNLTLDGDINLSTTPGGAFGAGVYRIFSYDGALTDNGLTVGLSPTPDVFVQTSLAHQVNLVNTTGLTLNFWDAPGHANDGAISGGSGTWRLTDNDYWTDTTGSLNASYSEGALAIFGGTAGTVTIDDANGAVSASGLQFLSDGYHIDGGNLTLAGGAVSVRVGDGSSAGKDMTATIDASLMGAGMLVKDDLGTLVLNGNNVYGGGTEVRAGTLQIENDGNLGLAVGALSVDTATLHTTGDILTSRSVGLGGDATFETDAGTTLQLAGTVGGSGSLTKSGDGTLILHGQSSYAGATTVAGGTLAADSDDIFNPSSAFSVQNAGTLELDGHSQHLASLANAGTVNLGNAPGTKLTIAGDYVGQGGTLNFDTALGGDGSATDQLVVTGNTSGNTTVQVHNEGGPGAQTTQGIKLIDVQGNSNGTFALKGDYVFQGEQAVVAGAYAYRLYKNGTDNADGDWYLRSALTTPAGDPGNGNPTEPVQPLYQPGVPLYEALAGVLQQLNKVDTLAERTGHRQWSSDQDTGDMKPGEGLWMRVEGSDQTLKPESSTSATNYDVSTWKAQAGIDTTLSESEAGRLVAGATLEYGRNHSDVHSVYGTGRIKTDDYAIGGALTWYGDHGFYVDGQVRGMRFDTDLRSNTLGQSLKDGNKGYGYVAGIEVGQRVGLGDHLWAVPQAQLSYGSAQFDSFNDAFGARVSQKEGKALTARGGLAIDYNQTWQGASGPMASHVYAIANVYRTTKNAARVSVAGADFTTRNEGTWGGFGLGSTLDWAGGRYSVYGELQASTGLSHFGDSHALNGTLGFRMRW